MDCNSSGQSPVIEHLRVKHGQCRIELILSTIMAVFKFDRVHTYIGSYCSILHIDRPNVHQ